MAEGFETGKRSAVNRWREIWEGRSVSEEKLGGKGKEEIFCELKRLSGFDVVDGAMDYDSFYGQYFDTKDKLINETEKRTGVKVKSIYEVGCGSGANLYLFSEDGYIVGGSDYSEALVHAAQLVLKDADLHYEKADEINIDRKYDVLLANSVFSYFADEEYAEKVLEKMLQKARYAIGLIDLHDAECKEAFLAYRKREIPDYDERYKDLPKFFYRKDFFREFAGKNDLDIGFFESRVKGYWNNPFVFNLFMYKK